MEFGQGRAGVFAADVARTGNSATNIGALESEAGSRSSLSRRYAPDLRRDIDPNMGFGYWGDYDDMAYDPSTCDFVRSYTDSSLGCTDRKEFTSTNVAR